MGGGIEGRGRVERKRGGEGKGEGEGMEGEGGEGKGERADQSSIPTFLFYPAPGQRRVPDLLYICETDRCLCICLSVCLSVTDRLSHFLTDSFQTSAH